MPEERKSEEFGAVWREQPPEKMAIHLETLATRRARELYSSTRNEIMVSIGAALFFVVVMQWWFGSALNWLQQLALLAVIVWVLLSLYRFRDWIRRTAPAKDALAAPGMEHYRKELERRRDHLKNAWIWHGPLFLACLVFTGTIVGKASPGRLRNVLPFVILLAVWTILGIQRRRREAKGLQREIDDIGGN